MKGPLTLLILQFCVTYPSRIEWIAKVSILGPVYLSIPDTKNAFILGSTKTKETSY